jgi:hypothetical protein
MPWLGQQSRPLSPGWGRFFRPAFGQEKSCRKAANKLSAFSGGTSRRVRSSTGMKYRGIEYSIVQALGHNIWKWRVHFDEGLSSTGQAMTKALAVSMAERAIDRALVSKKVWLVQPDGEPK